MIKKIFLQLHSEVRRTLYNDSINIFYFVSMIFWPIISFVQVNYNLKIFPLNSIKLPEITTESQFYHFIFVGYCSYVLFQNVVGSCWRLGDERKQGTLSQILMSPINKLSWLYNRAFAMLCSNTWLFLILFFIGNLWFINVNQKNLTRVFLSLVILIFAIWIWGVFISTFFIILRDGTVLFVLLEGPQDTFSGVQVPLAISPNIVRIIGSFFPLSYTISLLREILLKGIYVSTYLWLFLGVNVILIISSAFILFYGQLYMRKSGNFELY